MSTKVIDHGWKQIKRELKKLAAMELKVGVIGQADLAAIAMYNEFGTKHIPARPFMRLTFEENQSEIRAKIGAAYQKILSGSKAKTEAELIGVWYKAKIQRKITSNIQPANAESTIARKKSARTLIHDGRLRMAITFSVV